MMKKGDAMLDLSADAIMGTSKFYATINTKAKPMSYGNLRICYVLNGSADWEIDGRIYRVQTGDMILLTHRQKRRFLKTDSDFELAIITINHSALSGTAHLSFLYWLSQRNQYILRGEQLLNLLKEITSELEDKKAYYNKIISAKLTEFFCLAEREYRFDPEAVPAQDKNLLRILEYIDQNVTQPISLQEIAVRMNMTESAFSRRFLKMTGTTFRKYVMQKRVEYALFLLETTQLKVIDIAYECGFSSISGFYDTFKKITGTTPNKISGII